MAKNIQRRLAAILAADVVGYSRLMGEDEVGTLDALGAHRDELIEPKIAEHDGRIVKLMGDGLLAEFPSAVEAVQCAVEIQHTMGERNADVPKDRQIIYRIRLDPMLYEAYWFFGVIHVIRGEFERSASLFKQSARDGGTIAPEGVACGAPSRRHSCRGRGWLLAPHGDGRGNPVRFSKAR